MEMVKTEIIPDPPPSASSSPADGDEANAIFAALTAVPAIDDDDLQPLRPSHAGKAKYPPGCPVWYGLSSRPEHHLDAHRGVVKTVYIHEDANAPRVYKITNKDGGDRFLWQDQLAYAYDCPVSAKGMVENEPEKELKGVVVCPRRAEGELSYSVLFFSGGDGVRVEFGVEADQISFRKVEEEEASGVGGHGSSSKETNERHNSLTAKRSESSGGPLRTFSNGANQNSVAHARDAVGANSLDDNPNDRYQGSNRLARNGHPYSGALPSGRYEKTPFVKPHPEVANTSNPRGNRQGPAPRGRWAPNEAEDTLNPRGNRQGPVPRGRWGPNEAEDTSNPRGNRQGPVPRGRWDQNEAEAMAPYGPRASLGKRKPPPDNRSMRPRSPDRGSSEHPRKARPTSSEVECVFTVPLWVLQKCERDQELFHHMLGRGGEKTKYIVSQTNCFIHVSGDCVRKQIPSVVTIRTRPDTSSSFREVRDAIRMTVDNLKEFVDDKSSVGRLMHDLARSAKGNYNFNQAF